VERPHVVSLLGEVVVLPCCLPFKRPTQAWLLVPVVALWAKPARGRLVGPLLVMLAGLACCRRNDHPVARFSTGRSQPCLAARSARSPDGHAAGSGIFRYLASTLTSSPSIRRRVPVPAWHSDAPLVIYAVAWRSASVCARPCACVLAHAISYPFSAWRCWPAAMFGSGGLRIGRRHSGAPLISAAGALRLARRTMRRSNAPPAPCSRSWHSCRVADVERHGRFLDIDLDRANLPWAALSFVDQHGLRERMYNDFETGAFLIWRLPAPSRVR